MSIPAPVVPLEKVSLEQPQPVPDFIPHNGPLARLYGVLDSFYARREALGLSNPGTVENIGKEVQRDVFLTNQSFSGLRAELTKVFSTAPMFQVSHALSMGSQQMPPYAFSAMYGSPKVCYQCSFYIIACSPNANDARSSFKATSTMTFPSPADSTGDGPRHSCPRHPLSSPRRVT